MKDLLLLVGISLCLAYCSQRGFGSVRLSKRTTLDIPLIIMIIMLSLFCGLRTSFNDTAAYISGFQNAVTPSEFLSEEINLLGNPLFYFLTCVFRHYISANYHTYLLVIAFFSITSFVLFIRRHSTSFVFNMMLFFSIGLYISCFAAVKQTLAMAILTYAIDQLIKKKYLRFYLLVFLAVLFHSYAIMLIVLPFFAGKPWSTVTYLSIAVIIFVLFTFEATITELLDYAEELGKDISETEVFDTQSINILRLGVFAAPPLLSFFFQHRLNPEMKRENCILFNMSILSVLVMSLGLASAGNLFGRSAIYFEIGTIISLSYIISHVFERKSANTVKLLAGVLYLAFFGYSVQSFSSEYRAISLFEYFSKSIT